MIVVACVLLFFVVIYAILSNQTKESFQEREYLIVCAKYNKNTDFLKKTSIPSIVIEKNKDVPNVAHEATSYLYYILQNYESLPPNIIFIHDENGSWHHEGNITDNLEKWIKEYEKKGLYYEFNNMKIEKPEDYHNEAEKELWTKVFEPHIGKYKEAAPFCGKCCAQFIVSKKQILKHPKSFYQDYYDWLLENTSGEGNGDPKDMYSGYNTSRYAEWSWRFLFSP
jgi:hypothetical protein